MLYVAFCRARKGSAQERIARRLGWQFTEGIRVVGEYWLRSEDPNVIVVADTESVGAMVSALAAWDDHFETTIIPAIAAEDGLEAARRQTLRLVAA